MTFSIIPHGSTAYEKMIGLRISTLLEPIGIPANYIERESEKDHIHIGAYDSGELVGCCVLTPRDAYTIQLRQMAVRADLQGKKLGAAIIDFSERVAKERGFTTLMMHARNPVIGFYEKCGYTVSGEEFFEVGMGHRKMVKQLA